MATDLDVQEVFKISENVFNAYQDTIVKSYRETNGDLKQIIKTLLNKFGRSPNEIKNNRPDALINNILGGISIGFINSLDLKSKYKVE